MIKRIEGLQQSVNEKNPLIHCITNPISINDCANAVLAIGGKPIMAEHPLEVGEITKTAKALAVNLGNITDARLSSIMISGEVARDNSIPTIIDAVGVACSKLRFEFAKIFIEKCKPNVIKGNISEIKILAGEKTNAIGIDAGEDDEACEKNLEYNVKIMKRLSEKTGAVVVATGKTDIIVYGEESYFVDNGVEMLSQVTGTGCMLNTIIATFISTGKILEGAVLGTAMLGIAGERAYTKKGTASFRISLMDNLSTMTFDNIKDSIKLKKG